ncbi:MAG: hypothetical protein ACYCPO_08000 [Acidobacteriaceae bacterium]
MGPVPIISERCDLVVYRRHLHAPQIEALFNTLALVAYRREMEHRADTTPLSQAAA